MCFKTAKRNKNNFIEHQTFRSKMCWCWFRFFLYRDFLSNMIEHAKLPQSIRQDFVCHSSDNLIKMLMSTTTGAASVGKKILQWCYLSRTKFHFEKSNTFTILISPNNFKTNQMYALTEFNCKTRELSKKNLNSSNGHSSGASLSVANTAS